MQVNYVVNPDLKNVTVSVITPVYNVEKYISETLDSIVNQTLSNIEIIMVDDGSTDNSPDIIMEYAKLHSNIVFVKQDNSGPGAARNNGLTIARGEFISFVDSDDILPHDALETMYKAGLKEDADIVTGASLSFNSTKTWYIASHYNRGVYKPGEKALVRNQELLYSLGPCNKMFRSNLIKDIRFPKGIKVTEDHPFIIEAYLRAKKIYTVDEIIYNYRSRETENNLSLSQTVRVDGRKVLEDIFKSMRISDELWNSLTPNKIIQNELKTSYYIRMVQADIWPALNSVIKSNNSKDQVNTFNMIYDWLKTLDPIIFNRLSILHLVFTYQIVNRYTLLSEEVKKIHLKILNECFNKLDPGSLQLLETSGQAKEILASKRAWKRNSKLPIMTFLARRKIKKQYMILKQRIESAFVRRIFFKVCSYFPLQKKITLGTNKFEKLNDSFLLIYLNLKELRPDYKIVGHFKRKRTFKDYCKLYFDLATSRYIILDDYYRPLYNLHCRKGTDVIQTWHASGAFKKFGHSAVGYLESNTREFELQAHQMYTKAVVTSEEIVPFYAEAFDMPQEDIYPLGLARTDSFFNSDLIKYVKERYFGLYPQLKGKKVITYAPTFRGGPGERASFSMELDLVKMANELGNDYVLLLKLHPSVTRNVSIPKEANDFVINLSKNDINDVLMVTDILISDYSSLVFEYSLLERPMIFFAYDLESYLRERGFYYEYKEFVPGPIAKTTDEVISLVRTNEFDLDKINKFKHKFYDHFDGKSAKRFVDTLIEK